MTITANKAKNNIGPIDNEINSGFAYATPDNTIVINNVVNNALITTFLSEETYSGKIIKLIIVTNTNHIRCFNITLSGLIIWSKNITPKLININASKNISDNGTFILKCSNIRFIIITRLNVSIIYKYVLSKYLLHVNFPFSKELIAILYIIPNNKSIKHEIVNNDLSNFLLTSIYNINIKKLMIEIFNKFSRQFTYNFFI